MSGYAENLAELTHTALGAGVSPSEIILALELVKLELAQQMFLQARAEATQDQPRIIKPSNS